MLEMLHADETLIFCSDFPHFDWNDPVTVFPKLPEDLHNRIFAQNALDILRLDVEETNGSANPTAN
jgi:predicted TIM-barrel fold metal-dependent hydrolase